MPISTHTSSLHTVAKNLYLKIFSRTLAKLEILDVWFLHNNVNDDMPFSRKEVSKSYYFDTEIKPAGLADVLSVRYRGLDMEVDRGSVVRVVGVMWELGVGWGCYRGSWWMQRVVSGALDGTGGGGSG